MKLFGGSGLNGSIRSIPHFIPLFILILAIHSMALAQSYPVNEELRVFKNRYIVEYQEDSALQLSEARSKGQRARNSSLAARELKYLGKGRHGALKLVSRSVAAAQEVSTAGAGAIDGDSVPYDPNDQFCIDLLKSGQVKSCSPDFEIRVDATPNDPSFPSLWGMSASAGIDAPSAWDIQTGSQEVVVAVVDTGVDYTHPDLQNNMWRNSGEIAGNGIDDDANGYVDDVYGWNAAAGNGNPLDDNGHGTHCAGTIGGVGNNGVGVAGVSWQVKIMALKFLNANGSGSLSSAVVALNYMNTMKARGVNIRVSSNSWGGGGFSQPLFDAIQRSRDLGIIFVAAAGNEANDNDANPSYPATYELANIVSVAAVDQNRNLASFSNYGASQVDIAAPGVGILSTAKGGGYVSLSGTSMATPHVSGALALLLSNEPWLSYESAIDRVYGTGLPLVQLSGVVRTGRMLNAGRMIRADLSPLPTPTPTPPPCSYAAAPNVFAPDTSAGATAAVIKADELNYYTVDLPFSFPFFGENISRIVLSPNGLVYTKSAPSGMDYSNKESAPLNSIAALHTDLTTSEGSYGVRVAVATDHVTVHWIGESYAMKGQGDIQAWLTIYPDGTIDSSLQFSSTAIESYTRSHATVGIAGSYASNSHTYAYNAAPIASGMSVRYTPLCGGTGIGTVSQIQVFGKKSSTKLIKRAAPGSTIGIGLIGSGTGNVQVQASFGRYSCTNTAAVTLLNGVATLETKIPKVPNQFSSLRIVSGVAKKSIAIIKASASKHSRRRSRVRSKAVARKVQSACDKLFSSLSAI